MPMQIKNVLISDSLDPNCAKILSDNGVKVTTKTGLSEEDLKKEIKDYDGLIVRSATKVTEGVIEAATQLKIIGRAGVGVDNINCDAATKHGVLVINAPGGNTLSAAELTCAMIVSLSRSIPEACITLKNGKWDRKNFMGYELNGKTLAIVGLGRIGREVAHRMQAFGMRTIGFDPLVPAEESIKFGVESLELEQIWPQAHYITVHTPLIKQTKNLINSDVLAKCPKGVKIINCARGGIVDEDALLTALESGQCGGAGLDVFIEEPPKNTKLLQHPKVICTPHLGASTHEAQSRVADEISEQFVDLIAGKSAHGVVNSPAFSLSMAEENQPFVNACIKAGALLAALYDKQEGQLSIDLDLKVSEDELRRKRSLYSTAALIGVLKQRHQIDANFINAPTLAKEKGIEVNKVSPRYMSEIETVQDDVLIRTQPSNSPKELLVTVNMRAGDVLLSFIDDHSVTGSCVVTDNLILCKATSKSALTQYLGHLMSKAQVYSATFAVSGKESETWCAIDSAAKSLQVPDSISSEITKAVQLHL